MLINESLSWLQWFRLEGVDKGEVHLKLQWLSLKSDSSLLKEVVILIVDCISGHKSARVSAVMAVCNKSYWAIC